MAFGIYGGNIDTVDGDKLLMRGTQDPVCGRKSIGNRMPQARLLAADFKPKRGKANSFSLI